MRASNMLPKETEFISAEKKMTKRSVSFGSPLCNGRQAGSNDSQSPHNPNGFSVNVPKYRFAHFLCENVIPLAPSLIELDNRFSKKLTLNDQESQTAAGKVKVILSVDRSAVGLHTVPSLASTIMERNPTSPKSSIERSHSGKAKRDQSQQPSNSCLSVDLQRNYITLVDPTPLRRRSSLSTAKLFAFDMIMTRDRPLVDLCSVALTDALHAVIHGRDGCIVTLGHKQTGKTHSMLGMCNSSANAGIIPCAISWLYQLLNQQKEKYGVRYSVRVSAVEIHGHNEQFRDLLTEVNSSQDGSCAEESPSRYLTTHAMGDPKRTVTPSSAKMTLHDNVSDRINKALANQCELRAASSEKAAYLLDSALANRYCSRNCQNCSGLSHMLFTLHVYRCRVQQNDVETNVSGGRTRLHLFDLGCGRYGHQVTPLSCTSIKSNTNAFNYPDDIIPKPNGKSPSLSLSGMANVLLALLTGQRHLPFNDSALTYLLREAVVGNQTQPCILAHVSAMKQFYSETLHVIQLASKLGRLRRRRVGGTAMTIPLSIRSHSAASSQDDGASSSTEGLSDRSLRSRRFRGPRMGKSSYTRSFGTYSSEPDFSSSSEQSCDTVIYLGQKNVLSAVHLRKNWSKGLHQSPVHLGPRGCADGSVDFESCSGASDSTQTSAQRLENEKKLSLSPLHTSMGTQTAGVGGSIKRMLPRTNASVWPRSASVRKAKVLLESKEETWIDGPKAVSESIDIGAIECTVPAQGFPHTISPKSNSLSNNSSNCMKTPCNPLRDNSSFSPHMPMVKTTPAISSQSSTSEGVFAMESNTTHVSGRLQSLRESLSYVTGNDKSGDQLDPETIFTDHTATKYTLTLDSDICRDQRALSDISERTEETETVQETDMNGMKSSGPNNRPTLNASRPPRYLITSNKFPSILEAPDNLSSCNRVGEPVWPNKDGVTNLQSTTNYHTLPNKSNSSFVPEDLQSQETDAVDNKPVIERNITTSKKSPKLISMVCSETKHVQRNQLIEDCDQTPLQSVRKVRGLKKHRSSRQTEPTPSDKDSGSEASLPPSKLPPGSLNRVAAWVNSIVSPMPTLKLPYPQSSSLNKTTCSSSYNHESTIDYQPSFVLCQDSDASHLYPKEPYLSNVKSHNHPELAFTVSNAFCESTCSFSPKLSTDRTGKVESIISQNQGLRVPPPSIMSGMDHEQQMCSYTHDDGQHSYLSQSLSVPSFSIGMSPSMMMNASPLHNLSNPIGTSPIKQIPCCPVYMFPPSIDQHEASACKYSDFLDNPYTKWGSLDNQPHKVHTMPPKWPMCEDLECKNIKKGICRRGSFTSKLPSEKNANTVDKDKNKRKHVGRKLRFCTLPLLKNFITFFSKDKREKSIGDDKQFPNTRGIHKTKTPSYDFTEINIRNPCSWDKNTQNQIPLVSFGEQFAHLSHHVENNLSSVNRNLIEQGQTFPYRSITPDRYNVKENISWMNMHTELHDQNPRQNLQGLDYSQSIHYLSSIPSTPVNSGSFHGGFFTPAYRSTQRSMLGCGGTASSGYESMRVGASDMSHPDSASESSGPVQALLQRELAKRRKETETNMHHKISSPVSSLRTYTTGFPRH